PPGRTTPAGSRKADKSSTCRPGLPRYHGPAKTGGNAPGKEARAHPPGLGDSSAVCRSGGTDTVLTDNRLDRLALPQSRRYRERLAAGSGYDAAHAAILRELQAGQRARRNTPG